jgi:ABC-2 type transport system ATP-binding protein
VPDAIVVSRLSVTYPAGQRALDELSLHVKRGEIFGLLGANGAGKTTLIRVLTSLLRPSAGRVDVLGFDPQVRADAVKRRIGVVPQENNLDVDLDVRANLVFHCRYFGLRRAAYSRTVDYWLDVLGLADKAKSEIMHLSGGTKRKVMLAKAFLTAPEMLVLDEPTTGLDPEIRATIWKHIRDFQLRGGTVFLSTHHMEEAERLCRRVAVMQRGKIVACDHPASLAQALGEEGLEDAFQRLAEVAR